MDIVIECQEPDHLFLEIGNLADGRIGIATADIPPIFLGLSNLGANHLQRQLEILPSYNFLCVHLGPLLCLHLAGLLGRYANGLNRAMSVIPAPANCIEPGHDAERFPFALVVLEFHEILVGHISSLERQIVVALVKSSLLLCGGRVVCGGILVAALFLHKLDVVALQNIVLVQEAVCVMPFVLFHAARHDHLVALAQVSDAEVFGGAPLDDLEKVAGAGAVILFVIAVDGHGKAGAFLAVRQHGDFRIGRKAAAKSADIR